MPYCAKTVAKKIAKKVHLPPKIALFLLAVSLFSLASISSALPVNAAPNPSYKYASSGASIEATGGTFGGDSGGLSNATVFKFDSTQSVNAGRTYTTQINSTYVYNDNWFWEDDRADCQINLKISVNSDLKTGSISVTGTKDGRENSTGCRDSVAKLSDFNQSNISIEGTPGNPAILSYIVAINVTVNRTVSKDGKYNSKVILLDVNQGDKQIDTADTNDSSLNMGDKWYTENPKGTTVTTYTKFSNVKSGKYKACLDIDKSVCSDTVSITDSSNKTAIINVPSEVDPGTVVDTKSKTSCAIPGGIGWIVCPVVNFLAWTADGAFSLLNDNFLKTNPEIFGSATQAAWGSMRSIANIAFVIAFLIIIFSQITSVGITNYGIKKLLPRIIIAAILVNLSFFICQIAVDISNIVGGSARSFIEGSIQSGTTFTEETGGGINFTELSGEIVAGAAVTTGVILLSAGASLMLFVPLILGILAAILMTLLILIARQAIIILLVVISPLAFVAFLLPNTGVWFQKWKKTFIAMLILYPIIAVIYGASNLASGILATVFSTGETKSILGQIIAAAVLTLPLFMIPGILKKSLDAIPALGALASKWTDKATGTAGGAIGTATKTSNLAGRYNDMKTFSDRQRAIKQARGRANPGRLISALGGASYVNYANKQGALLENKEFEDNVASAGIAQLAMSSDRRLAIATGKDKDGNIVTSTNAERTSAIRSVMETGGYNDRKKVYSAANTASTESRAAISKGFFTKGDNKLFGGKLGGQIANGEFTTTDEKTGKVSTILGADGNVDTEKAMLANLSNISAETLVGNADATKDILEQAKNADIATQQKLAGIAKTAYDSASTQGDITEEIGKHLEKIRDQKYTEQNPGQKTLF